MHICHQEHTPFDVVAWHGKYVTRESQLKVADRSPHPSYVPYKYDTAKFIYVGSISRDHIDPSIFCVLTAKSKQPGVPLTDILLFGERWDVASHTFRPPVGVPARLAQPKTEILPSISTVTLLRSSWYSSVELMVVAVTTSYQVR